MEFGNPEVSITQNNLTVFTRDTDNVQTMFHKDSDWFSRLDNQYQMLSAVCGATNLNAPCIDDPNSPDCYG